MPDRFRIHGGVAARPAQGRRPGCASGGLAGITAISRPEDLSQRAVDDGSVLHDLRQRWFLFARQGLEGAGRAAKSAAKEELCADERPAEHRPSRCGQVAGHQVARDCGAIGRGTRGRRTIVRRPRASSWTGMPVAVVSQICPGSGIVRAVSLCAVGNRIIGPGLAVGDGTADDGACGEPTEHCGAGSVVPAMVPAVIVMRSAMPAAVLHGLHRLRGCRQPLGPGHRHRRRCGRRCCRKQ